MIINDTILNYIALKADGDARIALNLLDNCSRCCFGEVTTTTIDSLVTEHFIRYDKNGEEHHNAFIFAQINCSFILSFLFVAW